MRKKRDQRQSEDENIQCRRVTCAAVWRNCVGAHEDRGKETGFIRDGHAEENCGSEVGRFRPKRRQTHYITNAVVVTHAKYQCKEGSSDYCTASGIDD